jgi:hypothetical protein
VCDTSETAVVLPRYAKRMLVIDVAAVINSVVKVKLNGSDAQRDVFHEGAWEY